MNTEFNPAFDMPSTADQALQVLLAWSEPLTLTFSSQKSATIVELLSKEILEGRAYRTAVDELVEGGLGSAMKALIKQRVEQIINQAPQEES